MQHLTAAPRTTALMVGLGLLAGATAFASATAAAAPASPPATQPQATGAATAQTVQYRHWDRDGHRHWRGYRHARPWGYRGWDRRGHGHRYYGYGPGIAAGVAAIIGGSIAASQRDHGDEWQRCDDRYNSFRWSDGTFQPYGDGPRELCPYLR